MIFGLQRHPDGEGEEDFKSLDPYVIDKPAVTITNIRPPATLGRNVRSLDPRGAPLAEQLKATSPEAHPPGS